SNNASTDGGRSSTPSRRRYAPRSSSSINRCSLGVDRPGKWTYRVCGFAGASPTRASRVEGAVGPRAALPVGRREPAAGGQRAAVGGDRVADEEVRQLAG